jgi:hypothetical protein
MRHTFIIHFISAAAIVAFPHIRTKQVHIIVMSYATAPKSAHLAAVGSS